MARETTYAGILGDLQRLMGVIEANKAELPQLEPFWIKLEGVLTQALGVSQQQAALKAAKQEASKQMRRLTSEGQRLANVIRTAVKEHYGIREEKIAEFGLQPFRGRKVRLTKKPKPSAPPDGGPAGPTTPVP
ncbi:MAG TPA: hypothetical protein VF756_01725 [Thermoanaerobaculia bacterium]